MEVSDFQCVTINGGRRCSSRKHERATGQLGPKDSDFEYGTQEKRNGDRSDPLIWNSGKRETDGDVLITEARRRGRRGEVES
jgi:hypothetical protein